VYTGRAQSLPRGHEVTTHNTVILTTVRTSILTPVFVFCYIGSHINKTTRFTFVLQTGKKGKAVPLHAMEALGGERRYSSYSFSPSALDGGEWSASRPRPRFTPGERNPGTHCTGGWVGPRTGRGTEVRGKILCPRQGSNPDRPVVQPVVRHYTA
jgi:hypothetical protein